MLTFLLLLFGHLLSFSNGPSRSLEFVQYLEFAFDYIPAKKYKNNSKDRQQKGQI